MPALFERMKGDLRVALVDTLDGVFHGSRCAPLYDWIDAWLARAPRELPEHLRLRIAERRMHALDIDGMRAALASCTAGPLRD